MNTGIEEGSRVRVVFPNAGEVRGTVKHMPCNVGDSWVICTDDGMHVNFILYEAMFEEANQ